VTWPLRMACGFLMLAVLLSATIARDWLLALTGLLLAAVTAWGDVGRSER